MVDLVEAEEAVRHAVDLAERSAKVQVDAVVVSISAGRIGSERFAADSRHRKARRVPSTTSLASLAAGQPAFGSRRAASLLHALPIGFSLDGDQGVRDPRGMLAPPLRRSTCTL